MKKKVIHVLILLVLGINILRCNAAENGFSAPVGSTVTVSPEGATATFDPSGFGEVLFMSTITVSVPIGSDGQNANNIQGVISCAACTLYVFKDDVVTFLPQLSLLNPVAAGSFAFTTNKQGIYKFVFGILGPADLGYFDTDGKPLAYASSVDVDLGVVGTSLTYNATVVE